MFHWLNTETHTRTHSAMDKFVCCSSTYLGRNFCLHKETDRQTDRMKGWVVDYIYCCLCVSLALTREQRNCTKQRRRRTVLKEQSLLQIYFEIEFRPQQKLLSSNCDSWVLMLLRVNRLDWEEDNGIGIAADMVVFCVCTRALQDGWIWCVTWVQRSKIIPHGQIPFEEIPRRHEALIPSINSWELVGCW